MLPENNFKCRILSLPPEVHGHSHSHAHIVIPLTETITLGDRDEVYELSPGYMSFILPYAYHTYCGHSDNKFIVMNIPETMVRKSDYTAFALNRILPVPNKMMPLLDLIQEEITENPDEDSIRYLFYYFYEKFISRNNCKSIKYVHDHYSENISVGQLAAIENYNRFYYTSWFKDKTGFLPSEYIQHVRIRKSKALLENTRYKIEEIAFQVGYDSASSFSRVFKKLENQSPRDYRNSLQR